MALVRRQNRRTFLRESHGEPFGNESRESFALDFSNQLSFTVHCLIGRVRTNDENLFQST